MGMSAGQARLLSITARLTDNELRSQMITNSKLRLADRSSSISSEYMDSLNTEQLMFKSYNDDGNSYTTQLTPAFIYSYEPLKNQYSLQNGAGQNLVSATDAKNFEESYSLYDFLKCYDLVKQDGLLDDYKEQMEDYQDYLDAVNNYWTDNNAYLQYLRDYAQYQSDHAQYTIDYAQYEADHAVWESYSTMPNLYDTFSGIVGTSATASSDGSGTKYCYNMALNGNTTCYLHLLNLLLDFDGTNVVSRTYDTSAKDASGNAITVRTNGRTGGTYNNSSPEQRNQMATISAAMNDADSDGKPLRVCDGDDNFYTSYNQENSLKTIRDSGGTPSTLDILKSDYIEVYDTATGTYSYEVKSLKQKAIDMYYIISNGLVSDPDEMKAMLINFTDGDMQKLELPEPVPPVEPQPPAVVNPPTSPTYMAKPEKPRADIILNDKDKGQWYINLWYLMNGSESANKVEQAFDDDTTSYTIANNFKNDAKQNYKAIEDELFTSPDWLQFALSNGVITMKQVSYYTPALDGGRELKLTSEGFVWDSISYTSAADIVAEEDGAAISLSEIKYKNEMQEIENQDKKYDQDLKKLDTEHSALQTEYESLKSTIDKNVERSFKTFS